MNETIVTIVVAFIVATPGLLALLLQWKKEKSEAETREAEREVKEAETTEKIQDAALKMMNVYKQEFESLKCKILSLESRVKELEDTLEKELTEKNTILSGAWELHDQVIQLQGTPKYIPPKSNNKKG